MCVPHEGQAGKGARLPPPFEGTSGVTTSGFYKLEKNAREYIDCISATPIYAGMGNPTGTWRAVPSCTFSNPWWVHIAIDRISVFANVQEKICEQDTLGDKIRDGQSSIAVHWDSFDYLSALKAPSKQRKNKKLPPPSPPKRIPAGRKPFSTTVVRRTTASHDTHHLNILWISSLVILSLSLSLSVYTGNALCPS